MVVNKDFSDLAVEDRAGTSRETCGVEPFVLRRRDGTVHRTTRKLLRVEAEVANAITGESFGIGLVVNRERRRKAKTAAIAAQNAHTSRVERGDPHLLGHRTHERSNTLFHLPRCFIREGDGEDFERRDAEIADQVGNALGEHTSLARTGPSNDEQRAFGMDHGLVLDRIEALEEVGVQARRTVVEKGSHGSVTLPVPCDGLGSLKPKSTGDHGRIEEPDRARPESDDRVRQPNVQSRLNVRSSGCPTHCLRKNRFRRQ